MNWSKFTPTQIRLRKRYLKEHDRKRAGGRKRGKGGIKPELAF